MASDFFHFNISERKYSEESQEAKKSSYRLQTGRLEDNAREKREDILSNFRKLLNGIKKFFWTNNSNLYFTKYPHLKLEFPWFGIKWNIRVRLINT